MGDFSKLPNIGPVVSEQLNAAGVTDFEELKRLGAEGAWLKIQAMDPSACINRLLGLEGAIQGIPKKFLPEDRNAALKAFYQEHKL